MSKKIGIFVITAVLVIALTSMPIFADNTTFSNTALYTFNQSVEIVSGVGVTIYVTSYRWHLDSTENYLYDDAGHALAVPTCRGYWTQVYDINVRFYNSTDSDYLVNTLYFRFKPVFTFVSADATSSNDTVTSSYIESTEGELFSSIYFAHTGGSQYVRYGFNCSNSIGVTLPANTSFTGTIRFVRTGYYDSAGSISNFNTFLQHRFNARLTSLDNLSNFTATLTDDIDIYNADYNSQAIKENTQAILDAYTSNVQNAQAVTDGTDDNNSDLNTIHNQEQQWYSQNQSAIESTGLSNFNFSDTQVSGLNGVFSLFQRLWTSLGDFTFIYVFTLMISFATFVLRHRPSTRSTTKEKKVSSGLGGDSG